MRNFFKVQTGWVPTATRAAPNYANFFFFLSKLCKGTVYFIHSAQKDMGRNGFLLFFNILLFGEKMDGWEWFSGWWSNDWGCVMTVALRLMTWQVLNIKIKLPKLQDYPLFLVGFCYHQFWAGSFLRKQKEMVPLTHYCCRTAPSSS